MAQPPDAARVADDPQLGQFGYQQELSRSLSFSDLLIYGLIFMVPIAPFGIFGGVFQGSGGMVALAYAIGMVAMVFTALSYAQMVRAFPMAGSVYSYAGRGIAPPVGFLAGWVILLDYVLVPGLLYLVAAVAMNSLWSALPVWLYLALFVVLNTVVNYLGIKMTVRVTQVMIVGELIVLGRAGSAVQPRHLLVVADLRRGLDRRAVVPRLRRHLDAGRGEPGRGPPDRSGDGRGAAAGRRAVHHADLGGFAAGGRSARADRQR
jgi:hypothetical protein